MLSPRSQIILKSIVARYIERGMPVSSQSLLDDPNLHVSSATIRNEMAALEQEGYILRPHTSSGSVPSDTGYRYYVATIEGSVLPIAEQRLISHQFHQVENKLEEWLSLTAAVMAQLSQNIAVVTAPKPADCEFKHLELVEIQGKLALLILVLRGARVKQQLITFQRDLPQPELTVTADKLSKTFSGLTASQILKKETAFAFEEQMVRDIVVKIMQSEDVSGYTQSYLEGLHFLLNQPEFARNRRLLDLTELLERKSLLGTILPQCSSTREVKVLIGSENKADVIQDCSLVMSLYGLPEEACGTMGVVGPTRMQYHRVIAIVNYLSALLSNLMGELYGIKKFYKQNNQKTN